MPKVVGVRFRTSPRMYWFAPGDVQYKKGESVIVETQRGIELATVIMEETEIEESRLVSPLKPVLRSATDEDIELVSLSDEKKREMLAVAKEKVAERGLEMKVIDCEYTIDKSKLVLYFTAEQRVDFRELVRDLASAFHTRIDLRQIGPRDECKLIGSLGSCGLPCCCGRFESDTEHVSIKMAKSQGLALTPNKINGMCGRLLCCLSYENKTYEDVMKRAPKHGARVKLRDGREGSVVSVTPLTERVKLRVGDEENFEFVECDLADITGERYASANDRERSDDRENTENREARKDRAEREDRSDGGRNFDNRQNGEQDGQNRGNGKRNKHNRKNRPNSGRPPENANVGNINNGNNGNNGGGKRNKHKHNKRPKNGTPRPDKPNAE